MSGLIHGVSPRGASGMPKAPAEIQDALELWARKSGRTGKMHFFPPAGWFARLELKPNDPAMLAWKQGRAAEPPTEDTFFHVKNPFEERHMSVPDVLADPRMKGLPIIDWWNGMKVRMPAFLQLDIIQMGASGVTSFLEREDTWSGRGEFTSLVAGVKVQREKNIAGQASLEAHQEEKAGRRAHDLRRKIGKVPFLRVLFGQSKPGNRSPQDAGSRKRGKTRGSKT